MEYTIVFPEGCPTTRRSAIAYRNKIIAYLNDVKCTKICIDLKNTEIISTAFADESVGILVKVYGWAAIRRKLRIINGNGRADMSIARAIRDRLTL
jgi:cell fate regulator YaaT (PSP1 superfamily)